MIVNLMMHSILPEKMGNGVAVLAGEGTKQVVGIEDGNKLRFEDGTFQIVGIGTGVAALAGGLKWLASQAGGGIKGSGDRNQFDNGRDRNSALFRGSGVAGVGFIALCTSPPPSIATTIAATSGSGFTGFTPTSSLANTYSALGSNTPTGASADVVYVPSYPIAGSESLL